MTTRSGEFRFRGNRISYDVHGTGERSLVLVHGLLMNRRMYDVLAPEIASRGFQVVAVDLVGHGRSARPADVRAHSMTIYADLVAELIEHLGLDRPVVGGTSLGANVTLELAYRHPESARGLVIEMPVLEHALTAVGLIFLPVMLGLQLGAPALRVVAALARRVPRSNYLVDIGLDWIRQDPEPSLAVLRGLMFGEIGPTRTQRRAIQHPALIIGHHNDPLHPFSDSGMVVNEMPGARLVEATSILEWRLNPGRLNDELARFLDEVYAGEPAAGAAPERRSSSAA
jgi:pimeloyl-ACP methyl ester carboxylesterase